MNNDYKFRQFTGEDGYDERFATSEEMKRVLKPVSLEAPIEFNKGGTPLISDTKTAYIEPDDYHTLVLGSTGSMKTRVLLFPTVHALALAGENMVISDTKGEIYERTSGFLKEHGYHISVINLRDMKHSDSWNPLSEAYRLYSTSDKEAGLNMANDFITTLEEGTKSTNEPFWSTSATLAIQGCIEVLFRGAKSSDEVSVASLLPFSIELSKGGNGSQTDFLNFLRNLPLNSHVREHLENVVTTAPQTKGGIINHIMASFSPFTRSGVLQALSANSTIDMHAFSDINKKEALFLIVPDESTNLHFFASSFIKQLYSVAVSDSFFNGTGQLPRRLNFLLDEFANMPKIPDMPSMITAARSRNMRFLLVVQSDAQLSKIYGNDAEIIKTNCLNWVYLNSKEDKLIKQIQSMAGYSERLRRPLISYHELSSLRKDPGKDGGAEALILMSRCRPYISFLPDISRYAQFAKEDPVPFPDTQMNYKCFSIDKEVYDLPDDEQRRIYGLDDFVAPIDGDRGSDSDDDSFPFSMPHRRPSSPKDDSSDEEKKKKDSLEDKVDPDFKDVYETYKKKKEE